MDIAIVTGANTRIGLAISRKLIEIGCRVYGLGSTFNDFPFEHSDFVPVTCDLTNTAHLCQVVQEIIDTEKNIYVLVNHARYLNLKAHEHQDLNDLESLVHTNLLAPLILTRLALPSLIRLSGYVLNIGFPDLPGSHRLGSSFLSTEVALQEFSDRLYEEVRQDKVKVCSLILDTANVETLFQEGFTERDHHDLIVCSEATAQAVEYVISQRRESVVSRLVVRPQKREPDADDHKDARKLAAPKPYTPKKQVKKVLIRRLKKAVVPEPEEKGPATYMDMAREMAEEEALHPDLTENVPDSPPKRRRNRRGRRRSKADVLAAKPGGPEKSAANRPAEVSGRAPVAKASAVDNQGQSKARVREEKSQTRPIQKFRGPAKKGAVKQVARKRSAATKPAPGKKTSDNPPAKKPAPQGTDPKKPAAKKTPPKQVPRKAAKKRRAKTLKPAKNLPE